MEYREYPPIRALAPMVACLWTLEAAAPSRPVAEPVLPDGRPELILHLGDPFERLATDGSPTRQALILFAGQLTAPLLLRPTGCARMVGVRFHSHGATALLRCAQHELAGRTEAVDALSPALHRALRRVGDAAEDLSRAVTVVQHALLPFLAAERLDARVRFVVQQIGRHRGQVPIDRLARESGLTVRHLERRFLSCVGIGPKRLARISRWRHAMGCLQSAPVPLAGADLAQMCGYVDQSHLIRDFREFAGCSPRALLQARSELTAVFIDPPA